MNKKLMSIILSIAMVISMMPAMSTTSFANEKSQKLVLQVASADGTVVEAKKGEDYTIEASSSAGIDGRSDWSANIITVLNNNMIISGATENASIILSADSKNNSVTIDNLSIKSSAELPIISSFKNMTLHVVGTNTLDNTYTDASSGAIRNAFGIAVSGEATMRGVGKLNVSTIHEEAIRSTDDICITSTVSVFAENNSAVQTRSTIKAQEMKPDSDGNNIDHDIIIDTKGMVSSKALGASGDAQQAAFCCKDFVAKGDTQVYAESKTYAAIMAHNDLRVEDNAYLTAFTDNTNTLWAEHDLKILDSAKVVASNNSKYTTIWTDNDLYLDTDKEVYATNAAGSAFGTYNTITITKNFNKFVARGYNVDNKVGAIEFDDDVSSSDSEESANAFAKTIMEEKVTLPENIKEYASEYGNITEELIMTDKYNREFFINYVTSEPVNNNDSIKTNFFTFSVQTPKSSAEPAQTVMFINEKETLEYDKKEEAQKEIEKEAGKDPSSDIEEIIRMYEEKIKEITSIEEIEKVKTEYIEKIQLAKYVNNLKVSQYKLKRYRNGKIRVKFSRPYINTNKTARATVYIIRRATKKSFKKGTYRTYTISRKTGKTATWKNSKKLKKGKRYYYKVRARVSLGDGLYAYSKWSNVRYTKCKRTRR